MAAVQRNNLMTEIRLYSSKLNLGGLMIRAKLCGKTTESRQAVVVVEDFLFLL